MSVLQFIAIEPDDGNLHYLPLGATSIGGPKLIKIMARFRIKNVSAGPANVTGITYAFPGSNQPSKVMANIRAAAYNLDPSVQTFTLKPGEATDWSNGRPDGKDNVVYLDVDIGIPPKLEIQVTVNGHTEVFDRGLVPHTNHVPGGAYLFLYSTADLRNNEFIRTSAIHSSGPDGLQIFAHDIDAVAYVDGAVSHLLPGGDAMENDAYRVYGKPIYAIADGIVVTAVDDLPANNITKDAQGNITWPPYPAGRERGNYISINHGSEIATYCHLQQNSIPLSLKSSGATVLAGSLIGNAGNTGRATHPHTHIEVEHANDNAPRAFAWRDTWVLDVNLLKDGKEPWYLLNKEGIPRNPVAIWPSALYPRTLVPAAGFSIAGTWGVSTIIYSDFGSFTNAVNDLHNNHGRRLISASSYLNNGQRWWAGICRDGNWANHFWLSVGIDSFMKEIYKRFKENKERLIYVHTFLDGDQRMFLGIVRSGDWDQTPFVNDDFASFEQQRKALAENMHFLSIAVTWFENGKHHWFGLARTGLMDPKTLAQPQTGIYNNPSSFSDATQNWNSQGFRLSWFTSWHQFKFRRWYGIWTPVSSGPVNTPILFYKQNDFDHFYLEVQQLFDHKGLRPQQIEFLNG